MRTTSTEIRLTTEGEIASLRLNKFKEKDTKLGVELVRKDSSIHPLELTLANKRLLPSEFQSPGREKEFTYVVREPEVRIKKRLSLDEKSYILNIELEIGNQSFKEVVLEDIGLGWRGSTANLAYDAHFQKIGQLYKMGTKTEEISYKGIGIMERIAVFLGAGPPREPEEEECVVEGDIPWIAQLERYFLVTIIQEEGEKAFFRKTEDAFLEMGYLFPQILLPPGGSKTISFKVYAGPKDYDSLKALYPGAERLAGLNTLSLLTLRTLRFFYRFTHNYGLAIILLTIIIKILLAPLTHISLKSMKEMQKLAPEINRLKQRYKDDREGLNREVLALYKRYKINPMSGCLPLLAQMPFLYAIFTTLQTAVDLRGAAFVFWIKDLSDKDPFYLLPILMGITMFIQQKMAVTTVDPLQARIMLFMPIIFTIMFMGFPSGLVLYWLFQNILSIGQEYLVRRAK